MSLYPKLCKSILDGMHHRLARRQPDRSESPSQTHLVAQTEGYREIQRAQVGECPSSARREHTHHLRVSTMKCQQQQIRKKGKQPKIKAMIQSQSCLRLTDKGLRLHGRRELGRASTLRQVHTRHLRVCRETSRTFKTSEVVK